MKENDNKDMKIEVINENAIKNMVYFIRGQKVMLDFELAEIYGYETSKLNQQVKRNADKFPDDFMFQITKDELKTIMMSQNVISRRGGTRKLLYAFTDQLKQMPATQAFVAQNASFYNRKNNPKHPLANASKHDIISLGEIVQNMMDGVILLQKLYEN